ncbi:MAG: NUDIX domain-containing protein [Pseudomonadota bacterium]
MAELRARLLWRLRVLLRPPVTLGVRCMVMDPNNQTVLVRHTYAAGWHFPGGAVDPGESARQAAVRELQEETGLTLSVPAVLFGFYFHKALLERDHVALFVARVPEPLGNTPLKGPAAEIADAAVFSVDDLPADAAASVRNRIAEWRGDAPMDEIW